MLIRLALLLALIAFQSGNAVRCADADSSKLSVEAIGLRVSRPNALKERLLWPTGTTVSLLIASPVGELIQFSAADSIVAKFVDDKGTDLQERPKDLSAEAVQRAGLGHTLKIDKDAKSCLIEVTAPGLPAKGATRLQLAGTVTMLCATQKKETVVANVSLQNGVKIAGPNNLEMQIEEKDTSSPGTMTCVLRSQRELDDLAEIKFFHPDGSEVKTVRSLTSTLSIQGAIKVDWSYTFAERLDVGIVKLYTWSDIEKKRVKIDLTVDLGL